jgi:P pilus assembly chaperone PapD
MLKPIVFSLFLLLGIGSAQAQIALATLTIQNNTCYTVRFSGIYHSNGTSSCTFGDLTAASMAVVPPGSTITYSLDGSTPDPLPNTYWVMSQIS